MFARLTLALFLAGVFHFTYASASTTSEFAAVDFTRISSPFAPYACAIVISNSGTNASFEPQSSASLVDPTHAVTAAHNFDSTRARLALQEGRLFLSCPGQARVRVRAAWLQPHYRGCSSQDGLQPDLKNDLAVLLVTPNSSRSVLKLAKEKAVAELLATQTCGFLGYSPLVCDLSRAGFPRDCERSVNTRSIKVGSSGLKSRAKLDSGDSGSGLICFDRAGRATLLGVNMAAGSDLLMFSTSIARHETFISRSIATPDRDFISQSERVLKVACRH